MRSKIILGTVQFGLKYGINNQTGIPSDLAMNRILDVAYENNIRLLDSAEIYGNSQERIGFYHQTSSNRFDVITKLDSSSIKSDFSIVDRIESNLNKLKVANLYAYMFHSFSDYKKYFNIFKEDLLKLKEKGLINRIGVSLYTNEELYHLLKEEVDIDLIQIPFNLLDNHSLRSKVLMEAKKNKIEVHTRSVFLQGLFFKDSTSLRGNLRGLKSELKVVHDVLKSEKINMTQGALNYPLSKSYIDNVLLGVENAEQLSENLQSIESLEEYSYTKKIDKIRTKDINLLNPSLWKI